MSIVGHIVWWLKYSLAFLAKVAQVYFSIYSLQISLPERFAGSGAGSLSKDEILSYLYAIEQREMFLIERLSRCLGNTPQTDQFKS